MQLGVGPGTYRGVCCVSSYAKCGSSAFLKALAVAKLFLSSDNGDSSMADRLLRKKWSRL